MIKECVDGGPAGSEQLGCFKCGRGGGGEGAGGTYRTGGGVARWRPSCPPALRLDLLKGGTEQ